MQMTRSCLERHQLKQTHCKYKKTWMFCQNGRRNGCSNLIIRFKSRGKVKENTMKELQVKNENALPASSKEGKMTKSYRRTPLSNKTNKLAQNDASSTLLLKPRKQHGLRVFEETAAEERAAPPATRCTASTQTDPDEPLRGQESAVDRLVADMCAAAEEPSGEYWRQLADSRQQALEEALQENQQLHEQLDTAREEIRLMREVLEQAEGVVAAVQEWSDEQEQAQ